MNLTPLVTGVVILDLAGMIVRGSLYLIVWRDRPGVINNAYVAQDSEL